MIHYQLICSSQHAFDGWFKDSAGFDRQCAAGLVVCPECGVATVSRALMAPAITRRRTAVSTAVGPSDGADQTPTQAAPPSVPAMAATALPAQLRSALQRLRAEIEQNCDNVGDNFAAEARAIHNGDSENRGIYGQATPEQAEALADDGIEIAAIPWVPRADG